MEQPLLKNIVSKLRNPTVLLSVLSQVIAILILVGVDIDKEVVMGVAGMALSILATLGIINKVDLTKANLEVKDLYCKTEAKKVQHVKINGQWVCASCGEVYDESEGL